ncbi:MAG: methyltransferase domain-containing protein [Gammaproteobacteria bacterium]|nr:methyltransferase domain-containing protein [Gammaproteobacteria bacterium]
MTQHEEKPGAMREGLNDWLSRPPGKYLAELEQARLNDILPDLFGFHLLQVGELAEMDLLSQSRILHRSIIDIDGGGAGAPYPKFRGAASMLPVESDSVDVVILPHVLEFDPQRHETLRESYRVLVPEGHLIICGFNPRSLMGVWRIARRRRGPAPWRGHFLGVGRLKDWLALLGFDVMQVSPCFITSSSANRRRLERLDAFWRFGNRSASVFSGAYVMVARKRVTRITPIRTRWRPERRLVGVGLAEPSARVVDGD